VPVSLQFGTVPKAFRLAAMPAYEKGDFVKVEFPSEAGGISERMWLRVQSCDDAQRLIFGILDSIPLNSHGGGMRLGAELAVSYDKARDHKNLRILAI